MNEVKQPGQSLLENKDFDALIASEGYTKIETCSEMENFILRAARRFIELDTLQSKLADDDLSLHEPHARAWAVLYDTFCVSTSDLTTFFTETSDYHDLPPDEQKRLLTVAQTLTNSGRYPERIDQAEILTRSPEIPATQLDAAAQTLVVDGRERPIRNSLDQPLHWSVEGVRNFWRWFGDSKAVDGDGKPLVVYHSTNEKFTEFKAGEKDGLSGRGIYFSEYPLGQFGENVMSVYLKIHAPITRQTEMPGMRETNSAGIPTKMVADVLDQFPDFDGVINRMDVTVKSPSQIKSATDNSGLFDPRSNRIDDPFDAKAMWKARSAGQIKSAIGNSRLFGPTSEHLAAPTNQLKHSHITPEMEFAYTKAIESNNKREIIRLLERAAGVVEHDAGSGHDVDHDAPSPGENSGAPLYDISRNGIYPEDVYGPDSLRHYGSGNDLDQEALSIIRRLEAHPNMMLTVYRAVPSSVTSINPGDWVTTVRQYAKNHGEAELEPGFKILKKSVKARDLFTSGNSWLEFGYHPQDFKPEPPRTDAAKARSLSEQASIFRQGRPNSVGHAMELTPHINTNGLTRIEQGNAIKELVQQVEALFKTNGFEIVSIEHSGSAAGPSSYMDVHDPQTGILYRDLRFSGHSKGAFHSQFVTNIGNVDRANAVLRQMLERRTPEAIKAKQSRDALMAEKAKAVEIEATRIRLASADKKIAKGKPLTKNEQEAVDARMQATRGNEAMKLLTHQRQAVLSFAHKHGRAWKDELAMSWLSANYRGCDTDQSAALQQIRNQSGPTWLNTVTLKELQTQEAQHRINTIPTLRDSCGTALTFWKKCQDLADPKLNSPWAQIEEGCLNESILEHGQPPIEAATTICSISPGAITSKRIKEIYEYVTELQALLNREIHTPKNEPATTSEPRP